MIKIPSLKEIIESNSHVDAEQLKQYRAQLSKIRQSRSHRRGYRLASPINRRRIVVGDSKRIDSRTVNRCRI